MRRLLLSLALVIAALAPVRAGSVGIGTTQSGVFFAATGSGTVTHLCSTPMGPTDFLTLYSGVEPYDLIQIFTSSGVGCNTVSIPFRYGLTIKKQGAFAITIDWTESQ